jgi:hypothetical protein
MTFEFPSIYPSYSETPKMASPSTMRQQTERLLMQGLVAEETRQQPPQQPEVRWPRIFPSL